MDRPASSTPFLEGMTVNTETLPSTLRITSPTPIGKACAAPYEANRYGIDCVRIRRIDRANGESVRYADATDGRMAVRTVVSADLPLGTDEVMVRSKPLSAPTKVGKPMLMDRAGETYAEPGAVPTGCKDFPPMDDIGEICSTHNGATIRLSVSHLRTVLEAIEDRTGGKKERESQCVDIWIPTDGPRAVRFQTETSEGAPILALLMPVHRGDDMVPTPDRYRERFNAAWRKGNR